MINKDVLINDLLLLAKNFYKVIEVDLNNDLWFEVMNDENERPCKLSDWVEAFIVDGMVHEDDAGRLREFVKLPNLKQATKLGRKVFYRRNKGGEWRYVCAEVVPLENYSDDDAIVLFVVRDVEDYVKDFHEQVTLGA